MSPLCLCLQSDVLAYSIDQRELIFSMKGFASYEDSFGIRGLAGLDILCGNPHVAWAAPAVPNYVNASFWVGPSTQSPP